MVFGENKKLVPQNTAYSAGRHTDMSNYKQPQSSETVQQPHTLQNQLVKHYQQTEEEDHTRSSLQQQQPLVPENEEEILRFLDSAVLED